SRSLGVAAHSPRIRQVPIRWAERRRRSPRRSSMSSGSGSFPRRSRRLQHTRRVHPDVAQRLVLLSAVALLAGVAALAIGPPRAPPSDAAALPSAPAPAGWNVAFAGSRGQTGDAQRTTCGQVLAPESLGVTHPVLPCGAKVILRYGSKQVLTEVIDNSLAEPGRQLEVT